MTANRKALDHGQILSETSLGLWHQLVSKRWSTTLWPDIAGAFPFAPNRRRETVANPLADLRNLRNRIGHHHRIWTYPYLQRYNQILTLAGYIDPELRDWIAAQSTVPAAIANFPLAR